MATASPRNAELMHMLAQELKERQSEKKVFQTASKQIQSQLVLPLLGRNREQRSHRLARDVVDPRTGKLCIVLVPMRASPRQQLVEPFADGPSEPVAPDFTMNMQPQQQMGWRHHSSDVTWLSSDSLIRSMLDHKHLVLLPQASAI